MATVKKQATKTRAKAAATPQGKAAKARAASKKRLKDSISARDGRKSPRASIKRKRTTAKRNAKAPPKKAPRKRGSDDAFSSQEKPAIDGNGSESNCFDPFVCFRDPVTKRWLPGFTFNPNGRPRKDRVTARDARTRLWDAIDRLREVEPDLDIFEHAALRMLGSDSVLRTLLAKLLPTVTEDKVSDEQVRELLDLFVDIVSKHVKDRKVLGAIATELSNRSERILSSSSDS